MTISNHQALTHAQPVVSFGQNAHQDISGRGAACHRPRVAAVPVRKHLGRSLEDGIRLGITVAHKDRPGLTATVTGITETEITVTDQFGDRYAISRSLVVPVKRD